MIGLLRGTVRLCPHSPEWKPAAAQAIRQLREIFGSAAEDIQHIGSTAIPAISAKPILDIAVAVRSFESVMPLLPALEARGFFHRPQGDSAGQMLFACGDFTANTRTHHIHVVKSGGVEWRNYLNFRDYLNEFPQKAREYDQLKQTLARRFPEDRESYTAGKADRIRQILRDATAWSYLGKTVTVDIDRPMGFLHNSGGHSLAYPLNYGFLPGVIGGDGEELDVYVLGVGRPLKSFTGRVVGIVHRRDDEEDKLVAAPDALRPNQAQIAEAVHFAEQFYDSWIEPLYHKSCGAVVYRIVLGRPEFLLLLQSASRGWSFPKGHMESGESEAQTALREVREETGMRVTLQGGFRTEMHYAVPPRFDKTVVLFLAEASGTPVVSRDEISAFRWASAAEARTLLPGGCRQTLCRAENVLKKLSGAAENLRSDPAGKNGKGLDS